MIVIDGSYGEGGGQVLRTSVSLASVIGEEVCITNIRKRRKSPGLQPQHLSSIEAAALLCGAKVEGLYLGSEEVRFSPMEIRGLCAEIDIGTAGSIALVIQCIMPVAIHAKEETHLKIRGGTDIAWSPCIDYLENVTFKALERMGCKAELKTNSRGYYPKGGGEIELKLRPARPKGYDFLREEKDIEGISHSYGLAAHVVQRQASSAEGILEKEGYHCTITKELTQSGSTGSGINLWSGLKGASSLGKKGLRAEKVGELVAREMIENMRSKAALDPHLADQLIPFMGLAESGSFTTSVLTSHAMTNIWVTEQFLDVRFSIKNREGITEVSVQ